MSSYNYDSHSPSSSDNPLYNSPADFGETTPLMPGRESSSSTSKVAPSTVGTPSRTTPAKEEHSGFLAKAGSKQNSGYSCVSDKPSGEVQEVATKVDSFFTTKDVTGKLEVSLFSYEGAIGDSHRFLTKDAKYNDPEYLRLKEKVLPPLKAEVQTKDNQVTSLTQNIQELDLLYKAKRGSTEQTNQPPSPHLTTLQFQLKDLSLIMNQSSHLGVADTQANVRALKTGLSELEEKTQTGQLSKEDVRELKTHIRESKILDVKLKSFGDTPTGEISTQISEIKGTIGKLLDKFAEKKNDLPSDSKTDLKEISKEWKEGKSAILTPQQIRGEVRQELYSTLDEMKKEVSNLREQLNSKTINSIEKGNVLFEIEGKKGEMAPVAEELKNSFNDEKNELKKRNKEFKRNTN